MKNPIHRRSLVSLAALLLVSGVALVAQGCQQQDEAEKTAIPYTPEKAQAATPPPGFSQADVKSAQAGQNAAQQGSEAFQKWRASHPGQ